MGIYRKSVVGKIGVAPVAALLAVSLLSPACVRKVEKSDKAIEREQWKASLQDSIKDVTQEIASTEKQLDYLHEKIGTLLSGFRHVDNPREVEGYTILEGWQNRYPLKTTGIAARITEGEGFEIVAALAGGTFDAIGVESGGESAVTSSVPHDQALNYRMQGLNTVAFTAGKGDTVGNFVSSASGDVTLVYLSGGKRVKSVPLNAETRRMLTDTWELYSSQHEAEAMERRIPMLNSKLQAIRRMAGESGSQQQDNRDNL